MGKDTGHVSAGPEAGSEGMGPQAHGVHEVLHELALILGAHAQGLARIEAVEADVAALRTSLADELVTRRIRVLDDNGRERVRVGEGIVLIDEGGVERVDLSTGIEHGQILLTTTDPKTYTAWSAGEDLHSAEIQFNIYAGDKEAVSIGVDAGELAPGKPGIDPLCRLRGLDGLYAWGRVDGYPIDGFPVGKQVSMVRDAVSAANQSVGIAERCAGMVAALAEEVVTRRLRVVDEHDRTWITAVEGKIRCEVPDDEGTWVGMEVDVDPHNGRSAGLMLSRRGNIVGSFSTESDAELLDPSHPAAELEILTADGDALRETPSR